MGDPRKARKQYQTPAHPWNLSIIEEERVLVKEYGLGKKKEILIARSFLKKYKNIAKKLISNETAQSAKEKEQVMGKLQKLGLLTAGADLDDVLSLSVTDLLNRRLQSVVFRKGLARSMKQARQFITHRHVKVGGKEITAPGYVVSLEEESGLTFKENSALSDEEHPERAIEQKQVQKEKEAISGNNSEKAEETKAEPEQAKEEAAPMINEENAGETSKNTDKTEAETPASEETKEEAKE
jgi:small subunit ribosomal protein S4